MRSIQFQVKGELPPKKGGAMSMWGKGSNTSNTEARRVIALRSDALEVVKSSPFTGKIRLTLNVCVGSEAPVLVNASDKGLGDLDNFITGVCDGLMAAHPNLKQEDWNPLFWKRENASVRPPVSIAYRDDSQITEICAKKVVDPALGTNLRYEVRLEDLGPIG